MKRLLLILALVPFTAQAWTLAADRQIATAGAKLSPPDLYLIIKGFNRDYTRGLETALAEEGKHGVLRARIESETGNVIAMLKANKPMSTVAERLGLIAHLVADANNPYRDDDFAHYFEMRLAKFPTVFYGAEPQLRLGIFLDRMLSRTARFTPLVAEEYTRGSSASFDDHSTAFGVASVCYSHAVTDTANLFTYIWREAGGVVLNANH
ncbi:MAG TPA: hypothetical protein VG323_15005 [Thermoanaerobaculia bacterium]|nr:hypothetical protein [Thermoanaerobaculia bacterium]